MAREPLDARFDEPDGRAADVTISDKTNRFDASVLLIMLTGLVVQAVYLVDAAGDPSFSVPIIDAAGYHSSAIRFAGGERLIDDAFWQPPLFPLLLGCLYCVTGPSVLGAMGVLAVVASLSCGLVWWIGRRLFSRRVGIVAGLAAAFYGPFLFFSTQLLPTGLAVFLDLAAIALWIRCLEQPRWFRWVAFGVVVGFATITVPNAAVLVILAPLGLVVCRIGGGGRGSTQECHGVSDASLGETDIADRAPCLRDHGWGETFGMGVVALLGFGAVIAPVTLRNYAVSGEWVAISTNGGINFFIGNNPRRDETVSIRPGEAWRRLSRESLSAGARSRAAGSAYFLRRGLGYVAKEPLDFLVGLGSKARRLVNAREIPRNIDPYLYRGDTWILRLLMWRAGPFAFPFGLIAPLAALGVYVALITGSLHDARWMGRVALLAFIAAYGASITLFFVSARYRVPMSVALLPFAAAGAVWLIERFGATGTSVRTRLAGGVVLLVAILAVNHRVDAPTDDVEFEAERALCLGSIYLRQGKLDDAEHSLRRALSRVPEYAEAGVELAGVMLARDDTEGAESLLRETVEWDSSSARPLVRLGQLLARTNRPDEAIEMFQRGVAIDPTSPSALTELADLLAQRGRIREAIEPYRRAVQLVEEPGPVLIRFADALVQVGDYEEGIERYREGLLLVEPDAATLNRVAWLLATCPRAELRDCGRAIEIAEHLCQITDYRHAVAMDTLAAAYAGCGRWADAVTWSRRAIEQARAEGTPAIADSFLPRLEIYTVRLARPIDRGSENRP